MGKHFENFEIIKRLNKGSSTFDPENYVSKYKTHGKMIKIS